MENHSKRGGCTFSIFNRGTIRVSKFSHKITSLLIRGYTSSLNICKYKASHCEAPKQISINSADNGQRSPVTA